MILKRLKSEIHIIMQHVSCDKLWSLWIYDDVPINVISPSLNVCDFVTLQLFFFLSCPFVIPQRPVSIIGFLIQNLSTA